MPITERQRERRKDKIGSSDAASILGLDPFATPADVWASKVHDLDDLQQTMPIKLGNYLEKGLLHLAARDMGLKVKHGEYRVSQDNPLFASNLDGRVVGRPEAIEVKVVGRHNPTIDQWGKEGTDEVADHVMLQVQQQIYVAELEVVHVVAFIAGDLSIYRVERHDDLIEAMVKRCCIWWSSYVEARVKPSDSEVCLDVVKRVRRRPKTVVHIPEVLAIEFDAAKNQVKHWETKKDQAHAALLSAMGDSEAADWGDPERVITHLEQSRSDIESTKLRAAHPDIARQFTKTNKFRVTRFSKRKNIDDYSISQATAIEHTDGHHQGLLEQRHDETEDRGGHPQAHDSRSDAQDRADGGEPPAEADGVLGGVADAGGPASL